MVWILGALIVGAALGILLALAQVPRIRALPMTAVTVLLACLAVWPGFQLSQELGSSLSFAAVMTFILAMAAASSLYGAALWTALFPESGLTFTQLTVRGLIDPRSVRHEYAAMRAESSPSQQP